MKCILLSMQTAFALISTCSIVGWLDAPKKKVNHTVSHTSHNSGFPFDYETYAQKFGQN